MQERKIFIHDPLFGDLKYNPPNGDAFQWPSNDYACSFPFEYVEIYPNGNVGICCPQYNPVKIGNLLNETLFDIWNGVKVEAVRNSVLDGSYKYCSADHCPSIQHYHKIPEYIPGDGWNGPLRPKNEAWLEKLKNSNRRFPKVIHFALDRSCNLKCPSCRPEFYHSLYPDAYETCLTIIKNVFSSLCWTPHNEEITISLDGAGEVFHSELWRTAFDTMFPFTDLDKWPNIKFKICTNGTMLTPKYQEKYKKILQRAQYIEISVDAGDAESYAQTRIGGNWEQLWENLNYLYKNTVLPQDYTTWAWVFVLQNRNFRSFPEFRKKVNSYNEKKPREQIWKIMDWQSMGHEEFIEQAVWMKTHPLNEEYEKLRKDFKLP